MEAAKGKHVEASSIKEEDPIYDNLSGAIPFEQIYNSPLRTEDPLLDTVSFPEDNLVTHSFTKYHRSEYAANPSVIILLFQILLIFFAFSNIL